MVPTRCEANMSHSTSPNELDSTSPNELNSTAPNELDSTSPNEFDSRTFSEFDSTPNSELGSTYSSESDSRTCSESDITSNSEFDSRTCSELGSTYNSESDITSNSEFDSRTCSELGSTYNSELDSTIIYTPNLEYSPSSSPATSDQLCQDCGKINTEPRMLPCRHVYCTGCLESDVNAAPDDVRMIQCKVCNLDTLLAPRLKTVDGFSLVSVLSRVDMSSAGNQMACTCCASVEKASAVCDDCEHFFCLACFRAHVNIKFYTHHKVSIKHYCIYNFY